MNNIFDKIISSFANNENLNLTDNEFIDYDKFIDGEISNGNLIKYDEYNFIGEGLATKINEKLDNKIIALNPYDEKIDMRCKGQTAYFLVNNEIAILSFSTNAITFFLINN